MILGPFAQTPDLADAVDFTAQVADSYYSVVVPLKHDSKMWFIIDVVSPVRISRTRATADIALISTTRLDFTLATCWTLGPGIK